MLYVYVRSDLFTSKLYLYHRPSRIKKNKKKKNQKLDFLSPDSVHRAMIQGNYGPFGAVRPGCPLVSLLALLE